MSENHIQTLPDAVKMPFYRAYPTIQKEIRKHVDDMLENDIIEPSNSVWHSPVVMVKSAQESGDLQLTIVN